MVTLYSAHLEPPFRSIEPCKYVRPLTPGCAVEEVLEEEVVPVSWIDKISFDVGLVRLCYRLYTNISGIAPEGDEVHYLRGAIEEVAVKEGDRPSAPAHDRKSRLMHKAVSIEFYHTNEC